MSNYTEQQSRAGLIHGLRLVANTAQQQSLDSPFYSRVYGAFLDNEAGSHWHIKIEDHSPEFTIRALSKINPRTDRVPYDFEKPIRILGKNVSDFVAYGVLTHGREVRISRVQADAPDITDHLLFKNGNRAVGKPTYEGFSNMHDARADEVFLHSDTQRAELYGAFIALTVRHAVETADYVRHVEEAPLREYL